MQPSLVIGVLAEVVGFAAALAVVAITVKSYAMLPATITVHFDVHGRPDGTGPRWVAFVTPVVVVGMFVMLTVANPALGIDPTFFNGGPRRVMTLTIAFAGMTVLLSTIGRALISYNLGQARCVLTPVVSMELILTAVGVGLAVIFGLLGIA